VSAWGLLREERRWNGGIRDGAVVGSVWLRAHGSLITSPKKLYKGLHLHRYAQERENLFWKGGGGDRENLPLQPNQPTVKKKRRKKQKTQKGIDSLTYTHTHTQTDRHTQHIAAEEEEEEKGENIFV
jgi:hypothetical protein